LDLLTREVLKISRPKLTGVGKHFGVDLQDGRVVHFASDGVIQFTTPEGFACGRDVLHRKSLSADQYAVVLERLRLALLNPRPYHSSDWNCETFANWITEGKAESSQVNGIAVLAVIAL